MAPRRVVSASWQRSLAAKVDPERGAPSLVYEHAEVAQVRAGHPLTGVLPLLRDTLVTIADEAMHMMIVTDAQGRILWREGRRDVLRRGERVGLVEGALWSEESIGTNAMGTALASGGAVQIHAAEHLVRTYHRWTCAAAPIHDPETGAVIGVVDVSGPGAHLPPHDVGAGRRGRPAGRGVPAHPAGRARRAAALPQPPAPRRVARRAGRTALAERAGVGRAAVGVASARVDLPAAGDRVLLARGDEGLLEPLAEGWLLRLPRSRARPRRVLTLAFLGATRPTALLDGQPVRLSRRHAELLTLLALHPEGRTADELAAALHGDAGKSVTVRAEVHRLRAAIGVGVLRTQPYRLAAAVDADFLNVRTALTEGRVRDAALLYRGELLPRSDAPEVREERDLLAAAVHAAVRRSADSEAMWTLAGVQRGAGGDLTDALLRCLPDGDPRRAILAAR